MSDAQALIDQLSRQLQANDFDGGTETLTQLKVNELIVCTLHAILFFTY
jgi:hypothetical protein